MAKESLSIDGGPPIEAEIQDPDRADWVAGPVRAAIVDVKRDGHRVEILSGTRQGWTATAGHGISAQLVYLNGREPFAPPKDDRNEAAGRFFPKATEGK